VFSLISFGTLIAILLVAVFNATARGPWSLQAPYPHTASG
jgi:hypothetical protein